MIVLQVISKHFSVEKLVRFDFSSRLFIFFRVIFRLEGLDTECQYRGRILPEHTVSIKVSVETETNTFDKKPTEI
jgi:hypothetical protein